MGENLMKVKSLAGALVGATREWRLSCHPHLRRLESRHSGSGQASRHGLTRIS